MRKALLAFLLLATFAYGQAVTINGKPAPEGTTVSIVIPDAPQPPAGEAESPTGRNPRFIWSKRWQFNYNKARADNHSSWQRIKAAADGNEYGGNATWSALVYQITGDKAYAQKAIVALLPAVRPKDANYVREYYIEFVILYDWLLPAMTAEQKAEYEAGLIKCAEYSLGINQPAYAGGMRLGDSDQTVGQFFGVALTDLALGTKYLEQDSVASHLPRVPMGGLTATGADYKTARNAISKYCELAKGGQWIESTEYNLGTTKLLWMGVEAVKSATGQDHFPEATAFFSDLKQNLTAELTPGAQDGFQWGDTEKPHALDAFHRLPLNSLMGLRGVLPDKVGFQAMTSRAFYFHDPFVTATAPETQAIKADGVGILLVKDKTKLFASHMTNRVGVDHDVAYLSTFSLWHNGEWIIDAPRTYGVHGNNGMKLAGLLSMVDRKLTKSHVVADHAYQIGQTSGTYFGTGFYNPPPAFLRAWIRTVVYLPEFPAVVVYDSVDMDDPKKLPGLDRYKARTINDYNAIVNAPALKQWILHKPFKATLTSFADAEYAVQETDDRMTLLSDKATKFWNALGNVPVSQIPGGVQVGSKKITFAADGTPTVQ